MKHFLRVLLVCILTVSFAYASQGCKPKKDDDKGTGTAVAGFSVVCQPVGAMQSGNVSILYNVIHIGSGNADVVVEYSTNGGSAYSTATPAPGVIINNLATAPDLGVQHSFVWDTLADSIGMTGAVNAVIRISPTLVVGGNAGEVDTTNTFVVNNSPTSNEPPVVTITTPVDVQTGNIQLQYYIYDNDSDTCTITVFFSIDNGAVWYPAGEGPGSEGNVSLTSSPGGESHVFVWASRIDMVADTSPEDLVAFRIAATDTTEGPAGKTLAFSVDNSDGNDLPVAYITSSPPANTSDDTPKFAYDAFDNDGTVTGFYVSVDDTPPAIWTVGRSFTTWALSVGEHIFYVRARDNEGGNGPIAEYTFRVVSNVRPEVVILTGPGGDTDDDTPTFTWQGTDNDGTIDGYYVSVDTDPPTTWVTGASWTSGALPPGSHTFYIQAVDNGGELSYIEERTFFLWATKIPTVTITAGPDGWTSDNAPTFSYLGLDCDGTIDGYYVSIDTDPPTTWTTLTDWTPPSELLNGEHTFYVCALDNAGASSAIASRTFTVHPSMQSTGAARFVLVEFFTTST